MLHLRCLAGFWILPWHVNLFLIFKLYTSVPYNHISLKDNLKSLWSNKVSTSSSINLICFDQKISTLLIRAPRPDTEINESKSKKTKIGQYLFRSIESSHRRCFIKKVFFEISQNSQENTCDRVSRQQFYLKRGSRAGVFLWILRNLSEHLFHRTSPDDCSCSIKTWAIARKSNPKRRFCGVKSLWK